MTQAHAVRLALALVLLAAAAAPALARRSPPAYRPPRTWGTPPRYAQRVDSTFSLPYELIGLSCYAWSKRKEWKAKLCCCCPCCGAAEVQPEAPPAQQQPANSKGEPAYVEGVAPTAAPGWQLPMSYAEADGVQLQQLPPVMADGAAADAAAGGSPAPSRAAAAATAAAGRVQAFSVAVNAAGQPLLTPTVATLSGRQVLYEIPVGPVRGTLAFFHGCAHNATASWPQQVACPACNGLPEEIAHTKQALARGYAVIAIDSADPSGCWAVHIDRPVVTVILPAWLAQHGLQGKPLYVMGVSSGASFALKLPETVTVHGVVSEVLGIAGDSWDTLDALGRGFPPTAFISMPRDARTAAKIAEDMQLLRGYGVPTDMLEVLPRPVAADFLSSRSELVSPEVSAKVAAALLQLNMTDADGTLLQDPRYPAVPWRQQLPALVPEVAAAQDSLQPDASHISEELNLAYGSHEIVGDFVTACLAFLEARGTLPLAGLAEQFAALSLPGPRLRDLSPVRLHMLPMRPRSAAFSGGLAVQRQ
ncbi:hypothetical protein ABPG75_011969 [Micractinium tetrahymenae]